MIRRILISPNAFKGTLTAAEAAAAIARGLRKTLGSAVSLVECPVADGGDGFADVLLGAMQGKWVRRRVHNAVGRRIRARFALAGKTAVIELARASGLALLRQKNPLRASTHGTGELIQAALDLGARRVLLGIGGSASTDGGTGLARALGVRFLDRHGREVVPCGQALQRIAHIDIAGTDPRLKETREGQKVAVEVACDVENPLFGKKGAAHVFGPQKGATPAQVRLLDRGLRQLARVIQRDLGVDVSHLPGGGAAGGAGAGVVALLGGKLRPGFDLVAEAIGLREAMRTADLVVTGEGCLDASSARGKGPVGVLQMGRQMGVKVVALVGKVEPGAEKLGFEAIYAATKDGAAPGKKAAALSVERCAAALGRQLLT